MSDPVLVAAAKAELAGREKSLPERVGAKEITPAEAERSLAAWRAIVALLENRNVELAPCLGPTPAEAWPHLVSATHAALYHRAAKDDPRCPALRQIRSILIASAIQDGAKLTIFDPPAEGVKQAA